MGNLVFNKRQLRYLPLGLVSVIVLAVAILFLILPFLANRWLLESPSPLPSLNLTLETFQQFWVFYLAGGLILLVGVWTLQKRPRRETSQIFALFTAVSAITVLFLFDSAATQQFWPLWFVPASLLGGLHLWLTLIFPVHANLLRRGSWIRWLPLLPSLAIAVWGLLAWRTGEIILPLRIAYGWNGIALLISLGLIANRSFLSPSPTVRQRGRLVMMGASIGLLPAMIFYLQTAVSFMPLDSMTPSAFALPLVLYPLSLGIAITRFRLLNMGDWFRRGVSVAVLVLILFTAFASVMGLLALFIGPVMSSDSPLLVGLLFFLVIVLLEPLRTHIVAQVDRWLLPKPVQLDALLRDYNQALTQAVDADEVADTLLRYVKTAVPESKPRLFLPNQQGMGYTPYRNNRQRLSLVGNGHLPTIGDDSPLVSFMERNSGLIDLAEERMWPPPLRPARDTIQSLNARAIFPLNGNKRLLGWLMLQPKEDASLFSTLELNAVESLAAQSLIGFERAAVFRNLEARIDELDRLSQFSQALNFTISFDDLMELVYVNYQRVFDVEDFYIALREPATKKLYYAFYIQRDERLFAQEGVAHSVEDGKVSTIALTGQMDSWQDEQGYHWLGAPLNAGASTLGVLFARRKEPNQPFTERRRQLFVVFADQAATAMDRLQTRHTLQQRAKQLETVNELTSLLAATLEVDKLLALIIDKAIELLDVQAGSLLLHQDDSNELAFQVARGPNSHKLVGERIPIGVGLAGSVAQTGRPLLVNNVQLDTRWYAQVDAAINFHSETMLAVPLLQGRQVLGVIQLVNKRSGAPFREDDQQLLMAFAGQAVVALQNARLLAQTDGELRERVNELYLLQQLDRDLTVSLDSKRIAQVLLNWSLRICRVPVGAILLVNEEKSLTLGAERGYDRAHQLADKSEASLLTGLVQLVVESELIHVSDNVHEEIGYAQWAYGTHSQLTLPITHQSQLIGVLVLESEAFEYFTEELIETAVRLTMHAATALANARLYQQVHSANQAKSEFVSTVSHELKTPMTAMKGYADLMLSELTGPLTDQQRSFLQTILTSVERMSQQIQDLSDLSQLEIGRLSVSLAPVPMSNVVSEVLPLVQGMYDEKQIQLKVEISPDLPPMLADHRRVVQILTNLVSNAAKYSPRETAVCVRVGEEELILDEDEAPVPVIVCAVQDQGYGISEADQAKLFTKFFRSDDRNIRAASGTGLGLSITKGLVELQNGRIWLESDLGQGSTFSFALPQSR